MGWEEILSLYRTYLSKWRFKFSAYYIDGKMQQTVTSFDIQYSQQIIQVAEEIFPPNDVSLLKKTLEECDRHYSNVVMVGDNIMGFCIVKKRCVKTEVYELSFLGIHPDLHGCGWGSRLLRMLMEKIPFGSSCWLLVNQDNIPAQTLYSKFGFQILCDCLDPFMVPCHMMIKNKASIDGKNIYNNFSDTASGIPSISCVFTH